MVFINHGIFEESVPSFPVYRPLVLIYFGSNRGCVKDADNDDIHEATYFGRRLIWKLSVI